MGAMENMRNMLMQDLFLWWWLHFLFIIPGALVNLNLERNYEGGFYLRMGEQEVLTDIQKVSNRYILEHFSGSPEFQNMEAIHHGNREPAWYNQKDSA